MPDNNGNLLPGDEGYVAPVPQPGDSDYVDPNYVPPSKQPNAEPPVNPVIDVPEENLVKSDSPEYLEAKSKFSELYQKWNTLSDEEQTSEDGKSLSDELTRLHLIIESYENPASQVDPKAEPPIPPTQEGGENPNPPASLDEEDFKSNSEVGDPNDADLPGEQTVDEAGRPAGFNPFYHGDAVVHEENEILYQMPSDEMEKNKYRENR